jgi:hypothetical protein
MIVQVVAAHEQPWERVTDQVLGDVLRTNEQQHFHRAMGCDPVLYMSSSDDRTGPAALWPTK